MKILVSLLMLLIAMPTWAARQFDVEVIIFKRNVDAEKVDESWPDNLNPISYDNTGSLQSSSYTRSRGVGILPRSMHHLNAVEQRISNQNGYQVLLHTAWRQGDRGSSSAPTFHFAAGKNYASLYHADGSLIESTDISTETSLLELEGKLQIYVQHYLFANAEFDLRAPVTRQVNIEGPVPTTLENVDLTDTSLISDRTIQLNSVELNDIDADATPKTFETERVLKTYRFDQKRKMKSDEIHYFDHPLMGMIIQVRKAN